MNGIKSYIDIAFLSTYPPRESEIAIFTEDLVTTMDYSGVINTHVIAINNSTDITYGKKVIAQIKQDEKTDYIKLARKLNTSKIKLLVIEHEFGIYGGNHGDYILDLINNLDIPIATIFHTILTAPSQKERFIINELGKRSEKVITMAQNTKEMLHTIYGIASDKIAVIPYGVSKRQFEARELVKKKYGFLNQQVISTFCLNGQGSGLEYGIEAIAKVVKGHIAKDNNIISHKDVLYLILGKPQLGLIEEETYRNELEQLIDRYDIRKHVKFINRNLTKEEVIHYLQLSDIYMTPYLTKDQAVSSTLAYAVGYGKAIVSTPYLYAQEMLSEGIGLLAEYNNSDSLAECILNILEEPFKKVKLERNIMKVGRTMYWDKVVSLYSNLFLSIISSTSDIEEV